MVWSLADGWLVWKVQDNFIHMPVTLGGACKVGLSWASLFMSYLSGFLDFFPVCSGLQEQMFQEMGRDDCQPVGPGPEISTGPFHSILLVTWSHSPCGSKRRGHRLHLSTAGMAKEFVAMFNFFKK